MRRVALLFWYVLSGLLLCTSASAKQVALVVGINTYEQLKPSGQLQTAVNDSRAVGKTLKELGFEVIEANDVDRKGFGKAWASFLGNIAPGDIAVFYFAGHGVQIDNQNYLLPSDIPRVRPGRWEQLKRESLSLAEFLKELHSSGARLSLVIVDACRDSPFGELSRSPIVPKGLATPDPPRGVFLMFSAAAGQTALDHLSDDDHETNSPYIRKLLPLMKRKGLILRDLAVQVRDEVTELAKTVDHEQWPAYRDELEGRTHYCLAGCDTPNGVQNDQSPRTEDLAPQISAILGTLENRICSPPITPISPKGDRFGGLFDPQRNLSNQELSLNACYAASEAEVMAKCSVFCQPKGAQGDGLQVINACTKLILAKSVGRQEKAEVYNVRGNIFFETNNADCAALDYARAIELKPDYANPYFNLGMTFKEKRAAIVFFTQYMRYRPDDIDSFIRRANVYVAIGDGGAAIRDLNKAIDLDPGNPASYEARLEIYRKRGNAEAAIADAGQLIKIRPKASKYYNRRAWLLLKNGNAAEGMSDAEAAIELEKTADNYDARAHLFQALKQYDRALADYSAACRVGGESVTTAYQLKLNKLGYYSGKMDGRLGPLTQSAFRSCVANLDCDPLPDGGIPRRSSLGFFDFLWQ